MSLYKDPAIKGTPTMYADIPENGVWHYVDGNDKTYIRLGDGRSMTENGVRFDELPDKLVIFVEQSRN